MNVEVDPNQKSERPEWSTARYHALYSPQCGFELQVQWMVSTGGILGELVSSQWSIARYHALYCPQCGFELQVQWMVSTGGIFGGWLVVSGLQPGTMPCTVHSVDLSYMFSGWFLQVEY